MSDDVAVWLEAEREYQREKLAGAIADAMISQDTPLVVPGPVLYRMADRVLATGLRHGQDWVSVDDAAVVPKWVRHGVEELAEEPVPDSAGVLPDGVGRVVSWSEGVSL